MLRDYWGVITPAEADGIPDVLFGSEQWCREVLKAHKRETPGLGDAIYVVRVRLTIETIERGES